MLTDLARAAALSALLLTAACGGTAGDGSEDDTQVDAGNETDSGNSGDGGGSAGGTPPPTGRSIYVDGNIALDNCNDYDPNQRRCASGDAMAFRSLSDAAAIAEAGDHVLIRGGNYQEALIPANSGQPDAPIVFRAFDNETPVITGSNLSPAVDISNRQYLVIEGLTVDTVRRWLLARNTQHVTLQNNRFLRAQDPYGSSKTGLFFERAHYNRLIGNRLEDSTQDNLVLIDSNRNLIENNRFRQADHALWAIKCGDFNILRNNDFHNTDQKIGEIYDCDAVGFDKDITAENHTRRNLVEGNVFSYTPSSGDSSPYAGIQHAGQDSIIRRNLFHDTTGPGIQMTLYGGEARFNTGNRVFHNVFYRSDYAGVELSGNSSYSFSDNLFKNNVFFQSRFAANDRRWSWYTDTLDGKPVQIKTGRLEGFLFDSNLIADDGNDDPYLVVHGTRSPGSAPRSLAEWERDHPLLFRNSITAMPGFRDAENLDFNALDDSPLIDSGTFLTRSVGAGQGTALPVLDSGYFFDGYGIPGERGDEIQLQGQSVTARILSIDHDARILHLDRPLEWVDGQGVTLGYRGSAPDIGWHER